MRICIITQPLTANYGGLLQNYALQTVLKRMGHNPVTIDYIYKPTVLRYVLSICKTILLRCLGKKRAFIKYAYRRKPEVQKFINDYISVTDPVNKYTKEIIEREKADAIIVGSDQVWRAIYNQGVLENMFLKFIEDLTIKRIAYAASFGLNNLENYSKRQIRKCSFLIKKFDLVTVREDSGVALCKKYFDVSATCVCDPTLLLNKEDYMNLCSTIPTCRRKFIFAYILDSTSGIENCIYRLAMQNNMEIISATADKGLKFSIEEWLALFRDADFVVTNSFHGTVFSIIFNKPFYTISNEIRGNERLSSLLTQFGLSSRAVKSIDNLNCNVDWQSVNNKKTEFVNYSKKFLEEGLKKD